MLELNGSSPMLESTVTVSDFIQNEDVLSSKLTQLSSGCCSERLPLLINKQTNQELKCNQLSSVKKGISVFYVPMECRFAICSTIIWCVICYMLPGTLLVLFFIAIDSIMFMAIYASLFIFLPCCCIALTILGQLSEERIVFYMIHKNGITLCKGKSQDIVKKLRYETHSFQQIQIKLVKYKVTRVTIAKGAGGSAHFIHVAALLLESNYDNKQWAKDLEYFQRDSRYRNTKCPKEIDSKFNELYGKINETLGFESVWIDATDVKREERTTVIEGYQLAGSK
eukprot:213391_1